MAKRTLGEEEAALWRQVMRDVVPLHPVSNFPVKERKPDVEQKVSCGKAVKESASALLSSVAFRVERSEVESRILKATLTGPVHSAWLRTLCVGVRPSGLDNTQWQRLLKGKIPVDARLDLHGYTVQDAFEAFYGFMERARGMHWRCVEIVTGLGSGARGGMIRYELPHWLQREDLRLMVLSVVHSHSGNQGAVRILLKKQR